MPRTQDAKPAVAVPPWTFLTNHAHVLVLLARDPNLLLREVARSVDIPERAVQRIVGELVAGGYLEVERVGRRNRYHVIDRHPLRHPVEAGTTVKQLLQLLR
jgi:predicted ArsR family transcriptional regulator